MRTQQLRQWDNDFVWHPFTPMRAYQEENAPIVESGDGFFLIDTDGKRYLDGVSSLWCNVHGHRVPEIDRAIRDQLQQIAHSTLLGLSNVPSIELARELVQRTPRGLNKVFYSDSGATSVEIALKIAFQYHHQKQKNSACRDLFVGLDAAYHGDTVGAVSVGGIELFHDIFRGLLFETLKVPAPVTLRLPSGFTAESYLKHCDDELERTIVENHERIAAFVIEPLVQGAAGILVHPPGYLRRVRELTSDYSIPLIADEVAVGFGRTGTMFACEQESVVPDLLCLAKGISGGYIPLAATLATDEIYDVFLAEPADGKTFFHGHTYTGNPLGCAAALASLRLMDQHDILDNAERAAHRLEKRLREIQDWTQIAEVRRKGIMVGIEIVRDREDLVPLPPEDRIGHQITLAARKRGVMIRPLGDVVVLMPAPAMPVELIDQLCDSVFDAISEVCSTR